MVIKTPLKSLQMIYFFKKEVTKNVKFINYVEKNFKFIDCLDNMYNSFVLVMSVKVLIYSRLSLYQHFPLANTFTQG